MQAAKKLVLEDEFDREYKRLQRPTVAIAKLIEVHSCLTLSTVNPIADDQKVIE